MELIKVEGHPNLARDIKSGAIININTTEAGRIKEMRSKQRAFKKTQEEEINQLKSDVTDIKMMLSKLVEKL
tara:strand:- start:1382 stop:1597 length:216 start_codon:yes stop_codon:yes gene_type:complete